MSPRDNIENTIKQFDVDLNPDRDKEIITRLLDAQSKTKQSKPASRPEIWSIIMHSKITKLAAAVIIVGVFIGIHKLTGSIDGANVALADTINNMKKMPWVHTITEYETPKEKGINETWMDFEPRIWAAKGTHCVTEYINYEEDKQYSYNPYDPYSNKIVIGPVTPMNDPANHPDSPMSMIELIIERADKQDANILRENTTLNGVKVEIIHITSDYQEATLYRDFERNLLTRWDVIITIPKNLSKTPRKASSKVQSEQSAKSELSETNSTIEIYKYKHHFDYPEEGPKDIYDLGAPRDAEIEDYCPSDEVADLFSRVRQYSQNAYEGYIAVILENVVLDDIAQNQTVTLMHPTMGTRGRYMWAFKSLSWFHPSQFISGYTNHEMLPTDSEHEGLVGFRVVQTQKTILHGETERRKIIDEYWLDPERDYLVMEHVYSRKGNSLRWDINKRTITLATQQTPDGQWYPSHIIHEWEYTDDTGRHQERVDKQITLKEEPLIPEDNYRVDCVFNADE